MFSPPLEILPTAGGFEASKMKCVRIFLPCSRQNCLNLQGNINKEREKYLDPEPVLVLASNSPRRKELLSLLGFPFRTMPGNIDETLSPGEQPVAYARRLAEEKARAVAEMVNPNRIVVAADTIVVDGCDILGKPESPAEATQTLRRLRGRTHRVLTAISIFRRSDNLLLSDGCETAVPMRLYSDEEIQAYVQTGDPFDKAGAYAIQHKDFHPVEQLDGCYANVVGLPLCHLARNLIKVGNPPAQDVPAGCQAYLGYACPVYREVLDGKLPLS
jgi:septum formation protein